MLDMTKTIDLGDAEISLNYDSNKAPTGFTVQLTSEDNKITVKGISLSKFEEMVDWGRRVMAMGMFEEYPETGPEDEDDDDDDDDE